ncbi:hypothetical protein [Pseudomonas sp. zjy_14]|uniref:hypothetical protein n=1 Tax=Pseudomonas sp. zjy_14 TaxID=3367264 RepID=UPI00370A23DB
MLSLPAPWLAELNDEVALLTDPEGRAAVLSAMAYAALRRGEVDDGDLVDMLELAESARLWALIDREEVARAALCEQRLWGESAC